MLAKNRISFIVRFVVILVLTVGGLGVSSVQAGASSVESVGAPGLTPQVQISTPSYPIGMSAGETKLVSYTLQETANVSGKITSKSVQFFTQYDVPLSELMGPYSTSIQVNALSTTTWDETVSLPESVVNKARSMKKFTIVLKTTLSGTSTTGTKFSANSSLLLLLPPDSFSKSSPVDGAIVSMDDLSLQWNSSVGATDYEYCFDTIDNNSCDTQWTGTYWLSTYDTFAKLKALPSTTFYWQVRAANLSSRAYADNGKWWSFNTCSSLDNKRITVTNTNDSNPGSLRQAIDDVCPGGTITFAPTLSGQTIFLTNYIQLSKGLTIDGSNLSQNIKLDGASNIDTLIGISPDANPRITLNSLDFLHATRYGIYHSSGVLNLINANFTGSDIGIQNEGELTLIYSNFSDNRTGIVNFGVVHVLGGTFTNNGRGIYNEMVFGFNNPGIVTVTNSIFTQNHMSAIYNHYGTLTITGSTFNANESPYYGGGIETDGTATILNSRFINNTAALSGGAIAGNGIIEGGTFVGNTADYGGGISGIVNVKNSTFSNNTARIAGGGIAGDIELINSTFYNNSAPAGGGIYLDSFGTLTEHNIINNTFSNNSGGGVNIIRGKVHLLNNILANTTNGFDCQIDASTTIIESANNLIKNNAGLPNSCGIAAITSNPLLGSITNNGGSTSTMALLPDSPAIDAGEDTVCPATDQRGVTRPQGKHCDIGAYEYVEIIPKHPVIKSQALTPSALTTYSGTTNGSTPSLSLLDQIETDDDPAAYISFQTPNTVYGGYQSFSLPEDAQTKLISTMLLQLNVNVPATSTQVWTWSIYDWSSAMWIKVGDSIGADADQWQSLIFRIRQPWKYVSPGREIRIQLKSDNASGDAKIDYEALHITYLSSPATSTPVVPNVTSERPGIFSLPNVIPTSTPKP